MGKHDSSLSPDQLMTILRDNWVSVPAGIIVSLCSRTSIALLLSHVFAPYKRFKYYLISFTALMWVAGIVLMPLTFLQVRPVEALWNFTIVPESHWDTRVWLYTSYFFQCMNPSHKTSSLAVFRQVANSLSLPPFCSVLHLLRSHICRVPRHLRLEAQHAPSPKDQSHRRPVRFHLEHGHVHPENHLYGPGRQRGRGNA